MPISISISTDEKNFYYRAIQVHNREQVQIDLAEWRIPTFECPESIQNETSTLSTIMESSSSSDIQKEPTSSYILTLTIKTENKTNDFKRNLDVKYCFICNR